MIGWQPPTASAAAGRRLPAHDLFPSSRRRLGCSFPLAPTCRPRDAGAARWAAGLIELSARTAARGAAQRGPQSRWFYSGIWRRFPPPLADDLHRIEEAVHCWAGRCRTKGMASGASAARLGRPQARHCILAVQTRIVGSVRAGVSIAVLVASALHPSYNAPQDRTPGILSAVAVTLQSKIT